MSRYNSILDGTDFAKSSLAEGGYNYYLFTRPGGSGVIMRNNVVGTESKFHLFGGKNTVVERNANITNQWNARTSKGYINPGALNSL